MTGDDVEALPVGETAVELQPRVHLHEVVVRTNLNTVSKSQFSGNLDTVSKSRFSGRCALQGLRLWVYGLRFMVEELKPRVHLYEVVVRANLVERSGFRVGGLGGGWIYF